MPKWPLVFPHSYTLSIDGQHHCIAVTNADGRTTAMPITDSEIELLERQIETTVALINARNHTMVDGRFVLQPRADDMVFTPHGDQMNILMPVEGFRFPVSVRMSFEGIAIGMHKALVAMGAKPN